MVQLSWRPWRHPRSWSIKSTAVGAAGMLLLALVVPGQQAPAAASGRSVEIDALSGYEAQYSCRKNPMPGTVALSRWLQRRYPATGSMGLIRGCGVGGTSEHKDGRAFDWAADVRKRKTKRAAYNFIKKALATDSAGNEHALARRLGIMYLIYNDTIWASYRNFEPRPYLHSACTTKRKCSTSLRHRDHVHISLGYSGAAAQTSWYRARNISSIPVFFPRTKQLDPDATAVTALSVPATGEVVKSSFFLKAGVTYRFVATGTVTYAGGKTGDATCTAEGDTWVPTDRLPIELPDEPSLARWVGWPGGWGEQSPGSDHEDSPAALPLPTSHGLVMVGAFRFGDICRDDHTYEAWYTPAINHRVVLAYADATPSNNRGDLTVYVARDDILASSLARK